MSTTLTSRTARQDDWSFHLSPQTTQDDIDLNPEFFQVHLRTGGVAINTATYEQSGAITPSGQPRDNIKTGEDYTAEIAAETNAQQAKLFGAALESDTTDLSVTAATISTTATDIVDSGGTAFTNFEAGDFFVATGFADALLNVTYRITAKADNGTVTVSPSPASVEAEGATVTLSSFKASLGKAPCLYVGQNRVTDLSQAADIAYETFINGFMTSYGISIPETGIITSTANMVFEILNPGLLPIAGQTDQALDTSEVATTPLSSVWLDGSNQDGECFLKSFDLTIDNGYTGNSVAQCFRKRQGKAIPTVGGSLSTVMFIDDTYKWKRLVDGNIPFSLDVGVDLKDGKVMIISMGRVKATSWSPDGDTAMANSMDFSCEKDRETGVAISIYTNFDF